MAYLCVTVMASVKTPNFFWHKCTNASFLQRNNNFCYTRKALPQWCIYEFSTPWKQYDIGG